MFPDVLSYNVVGEIRGSEFPDEIIAVGRHLDSWDLSEGAHDDGAGCIQSIEVLRLMKALDYKPKRTIRAVMFMNEENGLRGGRKYAEIAEVNKENHIAAMESDEVVSCLLVLVLAEQLPTRKASFHGLAFQTL